MAKKTRNIVFEHNARYPHSVMVWVDREITKEISKIPGIVGVNKEYRNVDNLYIVTFDPRYDESELKSEIEFLVNSYAED